MGGKRRSVKGSVAVGGRAVAGPVQASALCLRQLRLRVGQPHTYILRVAGPLRHRQRLELFVLLLPLGEGGLLRLDGCFVCLRVHRRGAIKATGRR